MHSSTLIGKNIPPRVTPVERIEYAGMVHIKPKFVDGTLVGYSGYDLGADWGGVPGWTVPPTPCGNLIDVIV